ncbi:chemotaxis protein CheA [Tenuifilum sp.]|uniref:chemotaxis protein CheA n=1 Tax=Tenuifilum sp. TaxID=2760880 RepID=UPI002BAED037|nr:chemotaxis protein CheA [Tenuifilum sp.]HOK85162.1 chemotaxis protein CheA [Tenuifilum sp.]HPP89833.1 chemotaxis protein CheA [Tenuifilum sp.]HRR11943.1 chemotaxis protein CheA [Tenuifilum sp.]HRS44995.1 chemotaxis protein CheA [Tenuifilum sp.]
MDSFRKKFIEEAAELIDKLEVSLLELEKSPNDEALIQQVFRVMHTLKGNSAMFGFDLIDSFTHNLETIYDMIRNGQLEVSKDILNITFSSVDHLKAMLDEQNYEDPDFKTVHNGLMGKINRIINPSNAETEAESAKSSNEKSESLSTYYILFEPNENIFKNGTNPLYLLDELCSLGEHKVFAHFNRLPGIKEITPNLCYTYWEVLLTTDQDVNAIHDVFIFVESDSKLEIQKLAEENLLADKLFVEEVSQLAEVQKDVGLVTIQRLATKAAARINKEKAKQFTKERIATKDKTAASIRVSSDKLDHLMNLVSELVTTQARLSLFAEQTNVPGLAPIVENVHKLTRQLRDIAFSIVLIPIENLFGRFQRLVRDLSAELHKEVDFIVEGADTELDKTIIENLSDPLMHIIRNSMDHGIEDARVRITNGKPAKGKIHLKAFYSGASVIIQVSDDGAGIDPEIIHAKAISKGLVPSDKKMSKKEILDLIFLPGFSTAKKVTDVSGRGVGMDVVKKKISDIRGEVEVESEVGKGTTITIKLPLTLSIIDGLLVSIDSSPFVIPLSSIDKIYAVDKESIYSSFNNLVTLDGTQIPFFSLRKEFNLQPSSEELEQVVVVNFEDNRVGLVVDYVIGEYQAVLKPLGKHYKSHDIFSGATILGDGTVALVMDTNKIIKMFATSK